MTAAEPATTVSIASGPLVGPILRRVVGMLAARADLPLDRLDDAVLVADLIAARAPAHSIDDSINVALDPGDRSLLLRVGPLRQGGVCTLDWPFDPATGLIKPFGMAQMKRIARAVRHAEFTP